MKQIRGVKALEYARVRGLFFCVDEAALLEAESKFRGRLVSITEIEKLLDEQLGEVFDPSTVVEGSNSFDFLVERYGHQWIYVPLEGNHPSQEEQALLKLFQRLKTDSSPFESGDILDMITHEFPKLKDTGFPKTATLNLLFHAAVRLVEKGSLASIPDRTYYGNTLFVLAT